MATDTNEPQKKKKSPPAPANGGGGNGGTSPFLVVLRAAAAGNYTGRLDLKGLNTEQKELATLLNDLLTRVGVEQKSAISRVCDRRNRCAGSVSFWLRRCLQ